MPVLSYKDFYLEKALYFGFFEISTIQYNLTYIG